MIGKLLLKLSIFVCLLFLCSCGKNSNGTVLEKDDGKYQTAQRYYRAGRYQESMTLFLNIIENRRDAPQSQLEVGRLYLEHFNDPLAAIYHFKKFLEAKPDVEQSAIVRQMIERAKKNFAQTLPGRPFDDDTSRIDLMDLLKQLQDENLSLKKQLAQVSINKPATLSTKPALNSSKASKHGVVPDSNKNVKKPGEGKFNQYTVDTGDTLSKISSKLYGSAAQWELIFKANSDQLKTPNDLKIGQVLKIPLK